MQHKDPTVNAQQSKETSFADLPSEIIKKILGYLTENRDLATKRTVAKGIKEIIDDTMLKPAMVIQILSELQSAEQLKLFTDFAKLNIPAYKFHFRVSAKPKVKILPLYYLQEELARAVIWGFVYNERNLTSYFHETMTDVIETCQPEFLDQDLLISKNAFNLLSHLPHSIVPHVIARFKSIGKGSDSSNITLSYCCFALACNNVNDIDPALLKNAIQDVKKNTRHLDAMELKCLEGLKVTLAVIDPAVNKEAKWQIIRSAPRTYVNLAGAYLCHAVLDRADLSGWNFANSNFEHANLASADLSGSCLAGASLSCANLSGANLMRVYAYGAVFDKAQLQAVDFSYADLASATFTDAKMLGALLANASLLNATNLSGDVHFQGVKMYTMSDRMLEELISFGMPVALNFNPYKNSRWFVPHTCREWYVNGTGKDICGSWVELIANFIQRHPAKHFVAEAVAEDIIRCMSQISDPHTALWRLRIAMQYLQCPFPGRYSKTIEYVFSTAYLGFFKPVRRYLLPEWQNLLITEFQRLEALVASKMLVPDQSSAPALR